jgi:hypothetical protein
VIEEKFDGANFRFWREDDAIHRNHARKPPTLGGGGMA